MNCEQVEELLSAYLDNALAPGEREVVMAHLQQCNSCSGMLADFRLFDALIAQLPRISPGPALRERIFSSAEYLELTGTQGRGQPYPYHNTAAPGVVPHKGDDPGGRPTLPMLPLPGHTRRDTPGRPQLVAIPGGRSTQPKQKSLLSRRQPQAEHARGSRRSVDPLGWTNSQGGLTSIGATTRKGRSPTLRRRHASWGLRVMRTAIAVAALLTLVVGGWIGHDLWLQSAQSTTIKGVITPPSGPGQQGQVPFPVGMRFVFLRDGALWSTPADGSTKPVRITPAGVTVASSWVVSPPLPGRSAGDMIAYIDLQHALVHTIRSDGQGDTTVQQRLLKAGVDPSSMWDTDTGAAILDSLTWSKNGDMLSFVGDPNGTDMTNLYILTMDSGSVQMVPLPTSGRATHPAWSADGIRIAFELTHNGVASILDYNTQNNGVLTITNGVSRAGNPGDDVLALAWSPNVDAPTITWSVGVIGHVHSLWVRRVGLGGTASPQLLTAGDYVQAIYSPTVHNSEGSWLLVASIAGREGDLWYIDAVTGASVRQLTSGAQVGLAWWSPTGGEADYLDSISSGVGALHVVNLATGADTLIAGDVAGAPAPAWSVDSQKLVYSTGAQTVVVNLGTGKKLSPLKLHGPAATFAWSASSPDSLVAALSDGQQGIYLFDVRHNTSLQLDDLGINGSIIWTEVP